MTHPASSQAPAQNGSALEVFRVFLRLGLTSFGGPVAHLGFFQAEFVLRRGWLSNQGYADLVALCQLLPGPASSQVGFGIGLMRAGWLGALAAFIGFTLPSALLLLGFALSAAAFDGPVAGGALHGLKIVAVAIVAQAVWSMAQSLCPDRRRAAIAVGAVAILAFAPAAIGMFAAMGIGAVLGLVLCREAVLAGHGGFRVPVSRRGAIAALIVFAALMALLPVMAPHSRGLAIVDGFYRAGAMVFGGGHVVLPLLQEQVVASGMMSPDRFLAGYGAAQAVPGPLFSFAAYLGALIVPRPEALSGALLALAGIFLPGFLLLIAALPFWDGLRRLAWAQAMLRGTNAAVVGILGAALYSPVFSSGVTGLPDLALALTCLLALMRWHAPPWVVVILGACGGVALGMAG